ncbi:MAG: MotA/TolQ/ExbB proton channel family protein [Lachnospiraceae bacterium]|nr:MotA/TolQ/ExbB proton channel family protein [Lachnospiraceae bacterium]
MITSDSFKDYIDGLKCFFYAFNKSEYDVDDISEQIIELSNTSRKEGLLSLEEKSGEIENDLMRKGINLIVDGTDPTLVKDIMETERFHYEERNQKRIQFWKDLGAYSPAWGMVGTLLGLINMMHDMDDPDGIGSGMALALITTLYGSILANWVCIPISRKLQKSSEQEALIMEMVTEGVLSIQAGDNPAIIKEKLRAFREGKEEN